jgi:hypothetical protein
MNKSLDERLVQNGEYIDALNVDVSSAESANAGSVKNVKGNTQLTTLKYNGSPLSDSAVCIGAIQNESTETVYWFVHSSVDGVDMIVSYNNVIQSLTYHVISTSVLNFNPEYLITGVNIIDDLLLWTDNYNQPRKINVNRHYPFPVAGVDQISEADIALITAPPTQAPSILPLIAGGFENFMDTRFICFAYRYKYKDGEYSALSQFTNASFVPASFELNDDTVTNMGMTGLFNAVDITLNTGGDLVIGLDVCFKLNDSNVINVIEKFDKSEQGWPDSSDVSIRFSANKIYSTLPESELLRVYDNVPRLAKAQTIMGNRLTFGNYVDGYDIVDSDNQPITIDYTLQQMSEPIVVNGITDSTTDVPLTPYYIAPVLPVTSIIDVDFTNVSIQEGDVFYMDMEFDIGATTAVGTSVTLNPMTPFKIRFVISADADYATAYDFWSSTHFQETIGTVTNIQPIESACTGVTWTDIFECAVPIPVDTSTPPAGPWVKHEYGVGAAATPIYTTSVLASDVISFQFPLTMSVRANDTPPYTRYIAQYFAITSASSVFYKKDQANSLHSNRGYDIGIIYMDEFGRNSTSVICQTNTVFFPPGSSSTKNYIRTLINHLPPKWASTYKFSIKPSKGNYNIIYSREFYNTPALGNEYWFLLEGQNQLLPNPGSTLTVKTDTNGPLPVLIVVDVLDVQSQPDGFITGAPAGLYMKINTSNFTIGGTVNDFIAFETEAEEVNDEIYYEGAQTFEIINGFHQGNVLNQGPFGIPCVSDLDFFNCYAFGNGVEGYKINDGITSRSLVIGNRFSAVAEEDYSEAHRFATLTYSGVYNADTNINKLNEFNLALVNYKDLEKSFASIQKLHGRQTDILVLQEDKISYVLAGKNLLSDAAAGGAITSVPEVLGTQIARLEEYGISQNPESFASFGVDKFFTDATRGAVLKLTGSSYGNESLEIISEYGMGSWFRDEFNNSPRSQKIGGYDPFLDEYVLSIKPDDAVEWAPVVVPCGTYIDSSIGADEVKSFTLSIGEDTGTFDLIWTIGPIGGTIEFQVIYNGVTTSSGAVSTSGSMTVSKATAFPTDATVRIISVGGAANYELEITCP